ncbi:hypothetical protein JCM11491_004291 [Sporobolomyces phaffii]
MAASTSFVFKLHYDDGPSHVARRYGYTGKINLPAVYIGLFDRTAEVLSLPPGSFTLALRDSLGNPSIKLDSFQDFLAHVCAPLASNPDSVKLDEKGRRVLVFNVEKKGAKKADPVTESPRTDTPPRSAAPSLPSLSLTSTQTVADPKPESIKAGRPIIPLSSLAGARKSGYHAAYSTKSTIASPGVASPGSGARSPASAEESFAPKQTKRESWGTVRGMLETFVKDLNVHLADTFGDEAGSFRLNTGEDHSPSNTAQPVEVPEVKQPVETKAVHGHVFCDRCLKTISGSRFKCQGCSNYDLCEFCIDFRTQFHPSAHVFYEIARPGSAPVPSTRGAVEVEMRATPRAPSAATVTSTVTPPPPAPTRPVVHNATCDGCQSTITGTRKKCVECPDYDLCSTCHDNSASSIHPGHTFASIHTPRDLDWHPRVGSIPVHHHVRCDSCNKSPIRGVRYKCTHPDCPDYDLCANCESDPIARHPLDHHLLKIRQPRAPALFGIASGGGVPEALRRAQDFSQRLTGGGGCGSSHAQASTPPPNPIASILSSVGAAVQAHASTPTVSAPSPDLSEKTSAAPPVAEEMREVAQGVAAGKVEVRASDVEETAVKSESESDEEEEAEEKVEEQTAVVEEVERLGCSFVADVSRNLPSARLASQSSPFDSCSASQVTLQDGSIVPAGSEFCKVWKVRNSGTVAWASARLVNVGGFEAPQQNSRGLEVPDLEPGEEAEVQCECKAPEDDGRFMSFFRLQDSNGVKFGDRFWLDITVESDGTLRNSASLSSSSIVTPSLGAGGKAASVPATATSVAPSTTFSLSEVESDFESITRDGSASHFSSRAQSAIVVDSDEIEDEEHDVDDLSSSSSEESSELESSDSEEEFVVLSDEDGWRSM